MSERVVSIFGAVTGVSVSCAGGTIRCSTCGSMTFNAQYKAIPTDEYAIVRDSDVLRRKFLVPDGVPACMCHKEIWISDDDGACTHPLFEHVTFSEDAL